ncbi:MAG TPA: hypothetical protein VH394_19025 [Thermoanaerobaculia bacterium]|jgi:hypothetical protein|nr:hypothetical protein [Thermoanaerobaculia bacterium]
MRRQRVVFMALVLLSACHREPEKPEPFQPPADGRLTEAQVRLYLKGTEADFRPREYAWVRDRVQEARLAGLSSALDAKVIEGRRRILRSLEERSRAAADPRKKAELDRDIAEVRRLLQGAPPEPSPAVRANAELVARLEKKETK